MNNDKIIIDDMKEFLLIFKEASALRYEKLKCYGVETYKTFGFLGILMRSIDKINRIKNYYDTKDNNNDINTSFLKSNESIRDNLIDLINYLIMGIMILDNDFKMLQDKVHYPNTFKNNLPNINKLYNEVFKLK